MRAQARASGWVLIMVVVLAGGRGAGAQVVPERSHYHIKRSVPVRVLVPEDAGSAVEVRLVDETGAVIRKAPMGPTDADGLTDLAEMFPGLWSAEPRLMYAQLVVGERRIGPAMVMQPVLTPTYAPQVDRAGEPMFPSPETAAKKRVYSGLRTYVDKHIVFDTSEGELEFELLPGEAPNTCWNMRQLVLGGFFVDIEVHRVASLTGRAAPDIVQFGDPNGTGQGGPGYFIDLEPSAVEHEYGVMSMARGSDPNSGGSQVFVCLGREGTAFLDGKYTAFALLVRGSEALAKIAASPVNHENKPIEPPLVVSARLVDAPPRGEGPEPLEDPMKAAPER